MRPARPPAGTGASRPRVALVRCASYEQEAVDRAVRDAVVGALGAKWAFAVREPVLVKPNVLSASAPEKGICTHPAVLTAVLSLFRDAGLADLAVGDSSGGSGTRPTATDRALEASGLAAATRKAGARLLSFDHEEAAAVPNPRGAGFRPLTIARPVIDAGWVVSVPKFKTHALTTLTGAVKNLLGTVPGATKREYHRLNPSIEMFSNLLVDVAIVVHPDLHVVDAVVAMEGEGPSAGPLRRLGLILAGTDPVAVDALLAAIVGLRPDRVPTTRLGAERGLGVAELSRIEVVGASVAEVRASRFRLPVVSAVARYAPPVLTRAALSFTVTRPAFRRDRCTQCAVCVKNCPVGALALAQPEAGASPPVVDEERCIACFCCHELCPSRAVYIRWRHPLTRVFLGRGRRE